MISEPDRDHRGPRILHKLIGYIPERRAQRDRWVAAMQRDECRCG
jgi:hypothetical protein